MWYVYLICEHIAPAVPSKRSTASGARRKATISMTPSPDGQSNSISAPLNESFIASIMQSPNYSQPIDSSVLNASTSANDSDPLNNISQLSEYLRADQSLNIPFWESVCDETEAPDISGWCFWWIYSIIL